MKPNSFNTGDSYKGKYNKTNALNNNAMHGRETGESQYAGDHDFPSSGWSEVAAKSQLSVVTSMQGFWGLNTKQVILESASDELSECLDFSIAQEVAQTIVRRRSGSVDFSGYVTSILNLAFLRAQQSATFLSEVNLTFYL